MPLVSETPDKQVMFEEVQADACKKSTVPSLIRNIRPCYIPLSGSRVSDPDGSPTIQKRPWEKSASSQNIRGFGVATRLRSGQAFDRPRRDARFCIRPGLRTTLGGSAWLS